MKTLSAFLIEKMQQTVDGPSMYEVMEDFAKGLSIDKIRNKWKNEYGAIEVVEWLLNILDGVVVKSYEMTKAPKGVGPFIALNNFDAWNAGKYLLINFSKITLAFKKEIESVNPEGIEIIYKL